MDDYAFLYRRDNAVSRLAAFLPGRSHLAAAVVGFGQALREDLRGLACKNERQQEGDLAVSGRNVREGEHRRVVLPLADLLHGLCGAVCI